MRVLLTVLLLGMAPQVHAGDIPPIEVAQDLKGPYNVAASSFAGPGVGILALVMVAFVVVQLE